MGYVNKEYIKTQFENFSKRIASVFLKKTDVKTVATSGSYNDLSDKPTIPAVGNGKVTITQNGVAKGRFTMNQSGDATIALTDNNTTYSAATTSAAGLMSAADKEKLDGISAGAEKLTIDSALSSTSTNPVQNKVINAALGGKASTSHTHNLSTMIGSLTEGDAVPLDTSYFVANGNTNTSTYVRKPFSLLWEYIKSKLSTVATSGSYDDLSDKPTIPTVGNGTITIKQNGTSKGTFTTNQSGNTTIELTDNNTTYSNFVKSGSDAKAGLVPAPSTTAGTTKYLREDGTWTAPPNTNTDTKVTNTLAATTKAYVTGTTSAATNTGTQVFDTDVYLDTAAGQLTAKTFKGDLSGNASTAIKLGTARMIQTNLGSTSAGSFDGSANVTPGVTGTLPVANGGTGKVTLTSGAALIGNGTGAVATRAITNNTTKGASGWTSANGTNLITANTLAYWDGAYSGTSSNLSRCSKGEFGSIVTKNTGDYATATHSHDLSTMINGLSTGASTPKDADYYVSQYAGGGTTTTTYHRRPMSSLWAYIKSKLATVATSGSYNDLKNKPTVLSTLEQVTAAVDAGNPASPVGAGALAEVSDSVEELKTVSVVTDKLGDWNRTSKIGETYPNILAYNDDIMITGGTRGLLCYSKDGITWTTGEALPNMPNDITYGDGKFIVCCMYGDICYSEDGIKWTSLFDEDNAAFTSEELVCIEYIKTKGVYLVSDDSTVYYAKSLSDSWASVDTSSSLYEGIYIIKDNEDVDDSAYIVGYNVSDGLRDGSTWIAEATVNDSEGCLVKTTGRYLSSQLGDSKYFTINAIAYNDSKLLIYGEDAVDGVSGWTRYKVYCVNRFDDNWAENLVKVSIPNNAGSDSLGGLSCINNIFYIMSYADWFLYRSEDGINWSKVCKAPDYVADKLIYTRDKFFMAPSDATYMFYNSFLDDIRTGEEWIEDLYESTGEGKVKFRVSGAGRLEYSVYTE